MQMGLNDFSARDAINKLGKEELEKIFKFFGDENDAKKIALKIIKERKTKNIDNQILVKIIDDIKIKKNFKIHNATKVFQALRIFVNKEITELISGIIQATKKLKPGGKILVISFHSLEDKIVKFFFSHYSKNKSRPSRYLPENKVEKSFLFEEYKNKVIRPSKEELNKNRRSRSAKLRFAVRSKNKFHYPEELIKKFKKYIDLERIGV